MAPFPAPTSIWHTKTYESISPTRPEVSAQGKTIVVTGGGSGIGAEIAYYFGQAGASRIALLGRRAQPLLETKASIQENLPGVEVFACVTDITKKNDVDAAFLTIAKDGNIQVLVSNAATIGPQESVRDVNSADFLDAAHQNLSGALFVAQAFLRHASDDAVVINVSSSAAHLNFGPFLTAYSVAKMAVFRLWDSVGFANPNIGVFHVQPGVVDTAMNREVGGIAAAGFEDHVSLPASFSVWLASPEARFLKGKFLWANWDVDELKARAKEIEAGSYLNIGLGGWPFDLVHSE